MKLVVIFPDYQALGMVDFTRRIKEVVPDAIVRPILNGLPLEELERAAVQSDGHPIIASKATGLRSTLYEGYGTVAWHHDYAESTIVRLDTAEHPPEAIPALAQAAMDCNGMAIGDLTFDEHTLREGSIDEFTHLDVFPELYRQMTGGRLSLSCAHGFQAFAPGILESVFLTANTIMRNVELRTQAPMSEWGFDGAMALAALGTDVPVRKIPVTAMTLRDRPRAKVAIQFQNALQVCLAARDEFPHLAD